MNAFCSTMTTGVLRVRLILTIASNISSTMTGASPETRLVEHQQPGVAHHAAADREHLLLAAARVPASCLARSLRRGKSS